MQTTAIITLSASLCALLIVILLIVGTMLGGNLKEKVYRWFFAFLMANLLGTGCEIFTACLVGIPGELVATLIQTTDFFNYAFGSVLFFTLAMYIYEYLSVNVKISKKPFDVVAIFSVINIIISAIIFFGKLFVPLDENNYYSPQNTILLLQILPVLSMIIVVTVTIKSIKSLRTKETVSIMFFFILLIICYSIESLFPGVWVSYLGSTIAAFILYINIQVELRQRMKEQELELTESRIDIMLSQIQPHFLYNTLGAIDRLYFENPEEGHTAIIKFSSYLRRNMDSISNKKRVQFTEELNHVKQYLWLEKLRFEENLEVIYDIKTEDFTLPVLSLQPIVENAVRYGVTKKKGGGSVIIKTFEMEHCYRIVVIDDGVGFDPDKPLTDGRSHVGITNVRERLRVMCNGTLTMNSEPGKGTTAIIEIPKEEVL